MEFGKLNIVRSSLNPNETVKSPFKISSSLQFLQHKNEEIKMMKIENSIEPRVNFKFYNYADFIQISLLSVFILRALDIIFIGFELWSFIALAIFVFYILSLFFLNFFYFDTNRLVVFYPTRLFKRKVVFNYSEIMKLQYTNFRYSKGFVVFLKNKFAQCKYATPRNSFPFNWQQKKTSKFISFLKSKSIEVEQKWNY